MSLESAVYPFEPNSFAPRNAWYVAAFAEDLGDKPMARIFLETPVALYRKANGEAVAVSGRCPHRNFPLGEGCVKGDNIVCGYHGFAFSPSGQCVDIPSQDHVPKSYRIPTYPLVEHGIWLFIWMGDPELADPALLPDLEEIGHSGCGLTPKPIFTHEVKARYQLLNDNLLDLTHIAFLHGTNIGTPEHATATEELSQEGNVLRSRRNLRGVKPAAAFQKRHNLEGLEDHLVGMDFYAPGFHAGIGDHFYSYDEPDREGEVIERNRIFHAVTPSTKHSSYYFFGGASLGDEWVENTRRILAPTIAEDIFASEELEKMIELCGGRPSELMIQSDRNAVTGRRLVQAMIDDEGKQYAA